MRVEQVINRFFQISANGNEQEMLARIFHELLSRDHKDGCATWQPSRDTAGLVPRRTWSVRRRGRHPRTPGRTAISVVAASNSWKNRALEVPQQRNSRSNAFLSINSPHETNFIQIKSLYHLILDGFHARSKYFETGNDHFSLFRLEFKQ